MSGPPDEFAWIASLRPLTRGDERALDLGDDAAAIPSRAGFDLVISQDAMVEGVHFLPGEDPRIVGQRLLRTSLSDLAAKAAEPFGYLLMTAWSPRQSPVWRSAFADGLAEDGGRFSVALLGGDTVSIPGPATFAATVMGWVEAGRMVRRSGARAGDLLLVCGDIGDGLLGLRAAKGEGGDPRGALAARYRLPTPLFRLRDALRTHARAAADVSDGLLADAAHLAETSGLGLSLDLARMPLSEEARAWRSSRGDDAAAMLELAAGGDDYAVVCAIDPKDEEDFTGRVATAGIPVETLGRFHAGAGLDVFLGGHPVTPEHTGWRHLQY